MYVKINKAYLRAYAGSFEDALLGLAVDGFLAKDTDLMPYALFGELVGRAWLNPEKLIAIEPVEEPTPEWSAEITVDGDRLKMTVRKGGEELVYGKSYVQDTDDLGMMQAISYAAHMCYKMVQQRSM